MVPLTQLFLLAGCTAPAEDTAAELDVFQYAGDAEPVPQLDHDDLEELSDRVFESLFAYNAQPMIDVYRSLVDQETDTTCPTYFATEGSDYWIAAADGAGGQDTEGEQGGCVTDLGTEFRGWAYTQFQEDEEDEVWVTTKDYVSALAWIWPTDGTRYECAGTLLTSVQTQTGDGLMTLAESRIEGVFGWNGTGIEGTWTARGELPDLEINSSSILQQRALEIEGGVSNLQDYDEIDAFSMQGMSFKNEFRCALEPSGVLSLRAPDGNWYDITFDGPTEDQEDIQSSEADCDGCGVATFRGEVLGMVCPDFSPILSWELHPWE